MTTDTLSQRPDWATATDWPNRTASRFVEAGGLLWHVQVAGPTALRPPDAGPAPVLLLLHGTGAATHSWGGLLPLLSAHYTVMAPDLPGHGFTAAPAPRLLALPAMAAAVTALVQHYGFSPAVVIGHSAGAAIGARMCLDGAISPRLLVSLSGALMPLGGLAGHWFSPAAKLLARSGLVARFLARGAVKDPASVQRLVAGTGSVLTPQQVAHYRLLVASPGHVAAAIHMMANWNLEPLAADLPRLAPALLLLAFGNDHTVPPNEAERVLALLPNASMRTLGGYGHLAHEEDPAAIAAVIMEAMAAQGV